VYFRRSRYADATGRDREGERGSSSVRYRRLRSRWGRNITKHRKKTKRRRSNNRRRRRKRMSKRRRRKSRNCRKKKYE